MFQRICVSAFLGAVCTLSFAGGASANTPPPRVWTDHIPGPRAGIVPPVPVRRLSPAEAALQPASPVEPPRLEPLHVDPMRSAILQEIIRLKSDIGDARRQETIDQLGALYGSEMAGPFWVGERDFLPKARTIVSEIMKSDEWGIGSGRFQLPNLVPGGLADMAAGEVRMTLAVLDYANEAYGLRFNPNDISLWLDHKPEPPEPDKLLASVAYASDPAAALRSLHPSHPQFEALRQAWLEATGRRGPRPIAMPAPIAEGDVIKQGQSHPQVALVRERLGFEPGSNPTLFDSDLGDEVRAYLRRNGKRARREINDDLRALLNAPPARPKLPDVRKLEANMLRWRWLPRELGDIHIWNNLPEFQTRVVSGKQVVHQERIVVGQPDQQTPVFSDQMDHIVFKPQWGVPNSMKITDLLPRLRGGDTGLLDRRGMKIVKDGRAIPASQIRWATVDIRYLNIVQGPGDGNPLGELKFMFPNQHSVYMHDTTSRHLFSSSERTFSHGCIRVRNPRKLAEVLFSEVQKWDPSLVAQMLGRKTQENNRVDLAKPVPVHNVYFTLVADGTGRFAEYRDMYGHDRRMMDALSGKSLSAIAANDPARHHKERVDEIERSSRDSSSTYLKPRSRYAQNGDGEDERPLKPRGGSGFGGSMSLGGPLYIQPKPRYAAPRAYKPAWPPVFSFFD